MNDWRNQVLAHLREDFTRIIAEEVTPALAFNTACDLQQAQPFLVGTGLSTVVIPSKLIAPALEHLRKLTVATRERATELIVDWGACDLDDIEIQTQFSEDIFYTLHNIHCAWAGITLAYTCNQHSVDIALTTQYTSALDVLSETDRILKESGAKTILAAAWEYLQGIRANYPNDCEMLDWWYLRIDGPVHRAFEDERRESERAAVLINTLIGTSTSAEFVQAVRPNRVANTSTSRQLVAEFVDGLGRVVIKFLSRQPLMSAAIEDEGLSQPSDAMKSWFERIPHPHLTEVQCEIAGEGLHYISRRLTDDWRILINIDRDDGRPPKIKNVFLNKVALERTKPSQWVLKISPPHNRSQIEQLANTPLELQFDSGLE